jgi:hypothetical protein
MKREASIFTVLHSGFHRIATGNTLFNAEFYFTGLNPSDPRIAIFSSECPQECRGLFERVMKTQMESLSLWQGRFDVVIRHQVNDVEVPSLEADWDKLELRFDWTRMYSKFWYEELELDRRMTAKASRLPSPSLQGLI